MQNNDIMCLGNVPNKVHIKKLKILLNVFI